MSLKGEVVVGHGIGYTGVRVIGRELVAVLRNEDSCSASVVRKLM